MDEYVEIWKVDLAAKTETLEKIVKISEENSDAEEAALEAQYPEPFYSLATFWSSSPPGTDPYDPKAGDTYPIGSDPHWIFGRDELEELEAKYPNGIR